MRMRSIVPITTKTRTLSASYSRVDREYDALGRVYRESAPCDLDVLHDLLDHERL